MRLPRILLVFLIGIFPGVVSGQSFEKCEEILTDVLVLFNKSFETSDPDLLKSRRYQQKLEKLRKAYSSYHHAYISTDDSVARANNEAILMVLSGHHHRASQQFLSLGNRDDVFLPEYHFALTRILLGDPDEAAGKLVKLNAPNAQLNYLAALGSGAQKEITREDILRATPSGNTAKSHYNQGILLKKTGDTQSAVRSLSSSVATNDMPLYRTARGDAYLDLNQFDKALEDYDKAGKHSPDVAVRRGYTLLKMKQFRRARQTFRSVLKSRDRTYRAEALLGIANALYQEGDYPQAKTYYEQAAPYKSSFPLSQYGIGSIALSEHRYGAAKTVFDAIVTRDSTLLHAYLGRAIAHFRLGHYELALKDFKKSDAIIDTSDKIMADILVARGYSHYYSSDKKTAKNDFELAVALDPDRYEAWAGLGSIEIDNRQYPKAGKYLNSALAYQKKYDRLWNNYGNLLMHFGMFDKAFDVFSTAIGLNPSNLDAQNGRGITLLERDRLGEAKSLFDSLLRKKPQHPVLLNNRGIVHAYLGNRSSQDREGTIADLNYRLAENDFNLALETAPAKTFYHVNKGNVFRYWELYEDARLSYQTYQDKSALNNTAVLLAGLERRKDAEYYMNVALQLDSTHRAFHYNMNLLSKGKSKEMARFVASARDNGPYSEISIKYSLDGYVTIYLYDYEYQDLHFEGRHHLPPLFAKLSENPLIPEYDFRFMPYRGERKEEVGTKKKSGRTPKIKRKGRVRSGTKCPVLP